ncbi:hypothetical protein EYF80_023391 [Liparis tanakae]|uniref:Uncharacterized protein n=1 Tax=Liparis tanakae TaxID=230148 RepID=A0A4Z2HNL3_9TELE|nr:hypothetical protein EYF80_023391 [Liparis tanakae]
MKMTWSGHSGSQTADSPETTARLPVCGRVRATKWLLMDLWEGVLAVPLCFRERSPSDSSGAIQPGLSLSSLSLSGRTLRRNFLKMFVVNENFLQISCERLRRRGSSQLPTRSAKTLSPSTKGWRLRLRLMSEEVQSLPSSLDADEDEVPRLLLFRDRVLSSRLEVFLLSRDGLGLCMGLGCGSSGVAWVKQDPRSWKEVEAAAADASLSVCSLKEVSPQITQHGITQSVNAAATTGIPVWYGNTAQAERKALQRVVRTVERITGTTLSSMDSMFVQRCQKRAEGIIGDSLLHIQPETQQSAQHQHPQNTVSGGLLCGALRRLSPSGVKAGGLGRLMIAVVIRLPLLLSLPLSSVLRLRFERLEEEES